MSKLSTFKVHVFGTGHQREEAATYLALQGERGDGCRYVFWEHEWIRFWVTNVDCTLDESIGEMIIEGETNGRYGAFLVMELSVQFPQLKIRMGGNDYDGNSQFWEVSGGEGRLLVDEELVVESIDSIVERLRKSPTLDLLGFSEDSYFRDLELLIRFIDMTGECAILEALSEQVESEYLCQGRVREICEDYLRHGILAHRYTHLEGRIRMSLADIIQYCIDYDFWQIDWLDAHQPYEEDADPAREQPWLETMLVRLPPSEWAVTLEVEELNEPEEEDPRERRLPPPGLPTCLAGLTTLEVFGVLIDGGFFSMSAVIGLVARVLDYYSNFRLFRSLCEHIDARGNYQGFAAYYVQNTEPQITHDWQRLGF